MSRVVRAHFTVERNYAGWRLDAYLMQKIRRLTPEKAAFLVAERLDAADGRRLAPDSIVEPGLAFSLWREAEPEPEVPLAFDVVHDDGELLVVDKPAGLPIHPTARYFEHTFTAVARRRYPDRKVDPAHRLDRETSGLLACGTAPVYTSALKQAFAAGRVHKAYLALALGWPEGDAFLVDAPLALTEQSAVRVRMHVHAEGAVATTAFEVLGRRRAADGARVALLACRPRTGRQHQIRAHLHHAGLPLVGDKIYGPDELIFDRFTRRALTAEDQAALRLPRQALHAWRLELPHPRTGEQVALEAPLAPDLQAFWDGCR
ncbi:MAG TPA: RluA family pseudouridine synthase [Anaeromyxobacteraceae bacterium]|nr:RluA family pseudouridine synthase [Anaeromyxobacteraceae bacterium]